MSLQPLGAFPGTIGKLNNRPNLGPEQMKEALQKDLAVLWGATQAIIAEINGISGFATLPLSVANGGTGAGTKGLARTNLGVHVGNDAPDDVAASIDVGDIYIYAPTLP